jgi:hypothetical protein
MSAVLEQAERLHQNDASNVSEADQLKINPDTRQTPGLLRRLARPAIMMSLLPAVLGSVSPATADAHKAPHRKATHKHHKAAPPTPETPAQKAATSTIKNFAAQIIADYNQVKNNPPYQGVGYIPEHAPSGPGEQDFYVAYPIGPMFSYINNGQTSMDGAGGSYRLEASISYPATDKIPPSKINLNNVTGINISESTTVPSPAPPGPGLSQYLTGPSYGFTASDTSSSSTTKHQWELLQTVTSTNWTLAPQLNPYHEINPPPNLIESGTYDEWDFVAGPVVRTKFNSSYSPLTTSELQTMAGASQAILTYSKQYASAPVTPALGAPLGSPTKQECTNAAGIVGC